MDFLAFEALAESAMRIEAEERLAAFNDRGLSMGGKAKDVKAHVKALQKIARGTQERGDGDRFAADLGQGG